MDNHSMVSLIQELELGTYQLIPIAVTFLFRIKAKDHGRARMPFLPGWLAAAFVVIDATPSISRLQPNTLNMRLMG